LGFFKDELTASYRALLMYIWKSSGTEAGLRVDGLTPGLTYAIQIWMSQFNYCTDVVTILPEGGLTRIVDVNIANSTGEPGQYIIGYFKADSTSQTVSFSGDKLVHLNAVQVRESVPVNCWNGSDGVVRPDDFDADGLLVFDEAPGVLTNKISLTAPVTNKLLWFRADNTVYQPIATNKLAGGDLFVSGAAPVVCVGSNTVSNVVISAQSTLQYGESRANGGLLVANAVWCWGNLRWSGSNSVLIGTAGIYRGGGTFCVDSSGVVQVSASQNDFTGVVKVVSGTLRLGKNAALMNAVYCLEQDGCCEATDVNYLFQAKGLSGNGKLRLRYFSTRSGVLTGPITGTNLQIEPVNLPSLTNGFTWQVFSAPSVSGTFDLVEPDYGWYLSNPDGKTLWFKQGTGTSFRLK